MNLECPIVELRQYTLHPGARDTLVRVFEQYFIEGQEQHGMRVIGQFRDLTDPDRFVWLRGFADMETRTRAVEGFYSGAVWQEHGPAANAAMIDHTNVLLLKPAGPGAGFRFDPRRRPPADAVATSGGVVVVTVQHLAVPASADVVASLRAGSGPAMLLALLHFQVIKQDATRGLLVTDSRFTRNALQEIQASKYRMEGADGERIRQWLEALRTGAPGA